MATVRATNLMLEGGWTWGDGVRAEFLVTLEGVWGRYWGEWNDIWADGWRVDWVGKGVMRLVRGTQWRSYGTAHIEPASGWDVGPRRDDGCDGGWDLVDGGRELD